MDLLDPWSIIALLRSKYKHPSTDHSQGGHLKDQRVSSIEIIVVRGIPILYYILLEFAQMLDCQIIVISIVFFYALMSGANDTSSALIHESIREL